MLNFKDWLINEGSNPGSKTGLYPLGYGGIGLYPPQWYLTRSADAIFYLSIDDRIYNSTDKTSFDITHIPGKSNTKLNTGESGLWNIKKIEGESSPPKNNKDGFSAKYGEGEPWSIKKIPGKPSYTKNKDFVPNSGDGGTWNIKHIKK
jgi:hypothetical protein